MRILLLETLPANGRDLWSPAGATEPRGVCTGMIVVKSILIFEILLMTLKYLISIENICKENRIKKNRIIPIHQWKTIKKESKNVMQIDAINLVFRFIEYIYKRFYSELSLISIKEDPLF